MEEAAATGNEGVAHDEFVEKYGAMVLLDSLGTKGILATATPASIINDWKAVVQLFDDAAAQAVTVEDCAGCEVATFSDTIMVTMHGPHLEPLIALMGSLIFEPLYAALLRGIYLRGAMSVGRFYQAATKIIGPAIDEAAEWDEQADWIGVAATPTLQRFLELMRYQRWDVSRYFVAASIPWKSGTQPGWALAWPTLALEDEPHAKRDVLQSFAHKGGRVGVAAASKYRNTLKFFDDVIAPQAQP